MSTKDKNIVNRDVFLAIQAQKQQQKELAREIHAEDSYLYLITLNKKDVIFSDRGKQLANSLHAHMSNWYKSMEGEARDCAFLISGIDATFDMFENYILNKAKGKKKDEFETAFNDPEFVRDVKNLLIVKAYEHKGQMLLEGRDGFCSANAARAFGFNKMLQDSRGFSHEATNRLAKCSFTMLDGTRQTFTPEQLKQIQGAMELAIEDVARKLSYTPALT